MRNLGIIIVALLSVAGSEKPWSDASDTWRRDSFGPEVWRSDQGDVVRRDTFGPPTFRSNSGEVWKEDTFGPPGTWRKQ